MSYLRTGTTTTSTMNNNGPRAKCDQVVFEAMAKALEIVVSSRSNMLNPNNSNSAAATAAATSSRFNILVSEIASIRSILQRCRGASLHVPLRLDVYLDDCNPQQQDDGSNTDSGGNRQLLERWCLEYQVSGLEHFLATQGVFLGGDPIVQLRHVCKRVVVWLRTLCCSSRLLLPNSNMTMNHQRQQQAYGNYTNSPQQQPQIGFSLYVLHDGNQQDLVELQSQGFSFHEQPSSVVTPYGELGWKVACAPPPPPPLENAYSNGAGVFLAQQYQQQQQYQPQQRQHQQQYAPSRARPIPIASRPRSPELSTASDRRMPQSAPTRHWAGGDSNNNNSPLQHRIGSGGGDGDDGGMYYYPTNVNDGSRGSSPATAHRGPYLQPQNLQMHTYDPKTLHTAAAQQHHYQRSQTFAVNATEQQHPVLIPQGLLNRRHTGGLEQHAVGGGCAGDKHARNHTGTIHEGHPPERVMSGLSLALLMTDDEGLVENDEGNNNSAGQGDVGGGGGGGQQKSTEKKQRRAFHHMPPHLLEQQQQQQQQQNQQQQQQQGAYGYAYNNHIPWQTIHPSTTNPTCPSPVPTANMMMMLMQDAVLAGTPPMTAAFSSSLTNTAAESPTHYYYNHNNNNNSSNSNTSPTMSMPRSAVMTPPFTRPAGFAVDLSAAVATAPQLPSITSTIKTSSHGNEQQQQHHQQQQRPYQDVLPPLASYDLLHSSPFHHQQQQQLQHPSMSLFSSLTMGGPGDSTSMLYAGGGGSNDHLKRSLFAPAASSYNNSSGSNLMYHHQDFAIDETNENHHPHHHHHYRRDSYDCYDDMPFAVDDNLTSTTSTNNTTTPNINASLMQMSSLSASASFAQKLKHAPQQQRLKFFESNNKSTTSLGSSSNKAGNSNSNSNALARLSCTASAAEQQQQQQQQMSHTDVDANNEAISADNAVDRLAEQLAEFRSFGASLQLETSASASATVASASS